MELLKKHFVAFALNNAGWTINATPAEMVWLKDRGGRACTQGMAVFTAGGQMLGSGGGYTAAPNLKMLKDALSKYKPEEAVDIADPTAPVDPKDLPEGWRSHLPRVVPRPAKDGLALYVTWKALGLPPQPEWLPKNYSLADYQLGRKMLLVDRVWAGKAEADALATGNFPEKMKQRLAAHVGYVMNSKVKSVDLALRAQRLSGSFLLENGERCEALGFVAAKDGKVCRFDLIVKGRTDGKAGEGSGFLSIGGVVPQGKKTTAAVAFLLADPHDELAKVQPGSGKDLGGGEEKGPPPIKSAR
ncbi:MAG TPA: hypothetical protein VH682_23905 [Gemmataceae bacterium]